MTDIRHYTEWIEGRGTEYVIRTDNKHPSITLERKDGRLMSDTECEALIRAVQAYRYYAKVERDSAPLYGLMAEAKSVQFPKTRRDVLPGPCAYFVQVKTLPDLIKIGSTVSLKKRLVALRQVYGAVPEVVAYIQSARHMELERALHAKFSDCRCRRGEWFLASAVLDVLYNHIDILYEK
jgi:hypothetical protein